MLCVYEKPINDTTLPQQIVRDFGSEVAKNIPPPMKIVRDFESDIAKNTPPTNVNCLVGLMCRELVCGD